MCYSDIDSSEGTQVLSEEELEKMRVLRPFLIKEMNVESLLDPLLTAGCIHDRHVAAIKQYKTKEEMNGELLDILKRRSISQYKQFIKCLHETNQQHVINKIENCQGELLVYKYINICQGK